MEDYTAIFNKIRIQKGKSPVKCIIKLVHEGTILKCGCRVHNSSLSHFTVYHGPDCQSALRPKPQKWIVGFPNKPNGQAVATLPNGIIGLTNPWLGLFPHENLVAADDAQASLGRPRRFDPVRGGIR